MTVPNLNELELSATEPYRPTSITTTAGPLSRSAPAPRTDRENDDRRSHRQRPAGRDAPPLATTLVIRPSSPDARRLTPVVELLELTGQTITDTKGKP